MHLQVLGNQVTFWRSQVLVGYAAPDLPVTIVDIALRKAAVAVRYY